MNKMLDNLKKQAANGSLYGHKFDVKYKDGNGRIALRRLSGSDVWVFLRPLINYILRGTVSKMYALERGKTMEVEIEVPEGVDTPSFTIKRVK